ncbi:MAG: haloacid dehalogenase-like hydrolase [Muribaculaceae bacterium]|nr:haloacid dehalogenase-like hydrolase [Muribaculaceae bacterium]
MVKGHEKIIPAAAIDLDGTLLDTNTFVDYTRYAVKSCLSKGRINIAANMLWHIALRRLRLTSHSTMKHHLLRASAPIMTADRLEDFAHQLAAKANDKVVELCNRLRADRVYLCLATAAPDNYATLVARHFGFDHCIATPSDTTAPDWTENRAEHKLHSLLQHLDQYHLTLQTVVTDHHDDLPLLTACTGTRYLVNPSAQTLALTASISTTIL